jgi:hypothetical protein
VARPLSWRALAPRLPAATLVILGFAALARATRLPFGSIGAPDSGFYPTLVCTALIVFAAISCAAAAAPAPLDDAEGAPEPRAALRIWTVVAALALYGLALAPLGFVLCTSAFLVLLLRLGRVSWRVTLPLAAVAALASFALFTRLGVPLPPGLLSF